MYNRDYILNTIYIYIYDLALIMQYPVSLHDDIKDNPINLGCHLVMVIVVFWCHQILVRPKCMQLFFCTGLVFRTLLSCIWHRLGINACTIALCVFYL